MKSRFFIMNLLGVFILSISSWQCEDNPIEADLSHLSLSVNTLSIDSISVSSYWVAPNLGSNERLYLGTKNGLKVPVSFIEIKTPSPNYWNYYSDSTITIDSLHFKLYTNSLKEALLPNLYFKSGFHFDESKSTYLDFVGYSIVDWESIGQPNVIVNTDTSGIFTYTELVWDIMSIIDNLTFSKNNNNNTPLISKGEGTFAIYNPQIDYFEAFSEEATTGEKDPKVIIYYRRSVIIGDSTTIDTTSATIYSSGDLSIIKPNVMSLDSTKLGLSNGIGLRSLVSISFDSASIPKGSLIRKALLSLPIDTLASSDGYNIIVDPIDELVDTADVVFETDPYIGMGYPYPYRASSDIENGMFTISLKSFLQNITLGNETNLGFKVVANEKNDPFESINFDIENESAKPILEIIYVAN